jgi:exopolysaccharide biosynthesis polyprenyl glycosylphosphotransferase
MDQESSKYKEPDSGMHLIELRLLKLFNVFLMTLPFAVLWYAFYASRIASPYYNKGNWMVIALYVALYVIYGRTYDAFLVSYKKVSEIVYSQILSAVITNFLMGIVIWLLGKYLRYVAPMLLIFLIQIPIAMLWAYVSRWWYFRVFPPKKTVIVWDMRHGLDDMIDEYGLDRKFDVVATLKIEECLGDLSRLDGAEVVFLTGIHSHDRNIVIKYCIEKHITAFIIPRIGDVLMSSAKQFYLFHLPMLRLERYNPAPEFLFIKRTFDLLLSLVLIILLSPLMLVLSLLIRRDGGPAFYRQNRLTKDGKIFSVLKFRSMRVDAEKDGVARLSTGENDDRITPVGHFLRRFRLDELPQLFNILKGEMSFVGPRPERPEIAAEYEKELPEFSMRLQAKAGLTGLAQVYGKYNTAPYDKLQMDLMYIANPSLVQDIRIIFATIKILFMKDSTEGIPEGGTTAMDEREEQKTESGAGAEKQNCGDKV